MKNLLVPVLWFICLPFAVAQQVDVRAEEKFLALLHSLQYVETPEDLKRLIPSCPAAKADAGADNTEITIQTRLFGSDAKGEFNFHKGVLVSHGFEVLSTNYKDAHRTFLEAVDILDSQVNGLVLAATLPIALDDADSSDGPEDEITINLSGIHKNASFQLRLDLREKSTVVRWGAQKATGK